MTTNPSVVLVEDHPDTREVLTRLLRLLGCAVKAAGTVNDAKSLASNETFDLLISDMSLPDGDGIDVVQFVKAKRPHIKSIALSGYGTEEDRIRSRNAGFDMHLTKPVDLRALDQALRACSAE